LQVHVSLVVAEAREMLLTPAEGSVKERRGFFAEQRPLVAKRSKGPPTGHHPRAVLPVSRGRYPRKLKPLLGELKRSHPAGCAKLPQAPLHHSSASSSRFEVVVDIATGTPSFPRVARLLLRKPRAYDTSSQGGGGFHQSAASGLSVVPLAYSPTRRS